MNHMPEEPIYKRNIAQEWYQYGLNHHNDFFMRFMMHWIAFNWLYSSEENEQYERDKILSFYEKNQQKFNRFDPFVTLDIDVFKKSPITNGLSNYKMHKDFEGVKAGKAEALLMSIYQVRCNLFHGSKSLRIDRDRDLVRASANILEGYLKELLKEDNH